MAWIGAVASIAGSLIASSASKDAGSTQANAANNATNAQQAIFNTQNQQQAPYRQAGYNALGEISRGFGLPSPSSSPGGAGATIPTGGVSNTDFGPGGRFVRVATPGYTGPTGQYSGQGTGYIDSTTGKYVGDDGQAQQIIAKINGALPPVADDPNRVQSGQFSHQFNADDLKTNLAPNYQFQLDQGMRATRNAANLQTGLLSGNTLKGLEDYAQNYAGGAYQNAFNNYTANQSNIFNRLSTVAGLGSAANQQSGSLAGQIAPGVAGSTFGAGAAQAAGTVGSANALSGGLTNALGWYKANQNGGSGLSDLMDESSFNG